MKLAKKATSSSLVRWLLLFLTLTYGTNLLAQTCVQPPSGIIAWWPFDETSGNIAGDRIGNHPAAYANGPVPAAGKVRGALRFNGSNYVAAQDSDEWAFGTGDLTVELWANFDAPPGGDIVHAGDIFIGSDDGPGNVNKWFFALGGGVLHFTVYNTVSPPPNFYLVRAPFSPILGQWYHLAVTKRGTLFTIYVNGVPVGSETSLSPIANAAAPLTIGQAEQLGFMRGVLDEVTIYNRALTDEELKAIVDSGSTGKCINLSIRPNKGGDTGVVSVHVDGVGFTPQAGLKLTRVGQPDITATSVQVGPYGTTMDAVFDLTGMLQGSWDVVVTNPSGVPITLTNGFTIEQGRPPELWVDIVGLNLIRAGREGTYWINVGNSGNVNVPVSTLFVSLPRDVDYQVHLPGIDGHVSEPVVVGNADNDIVTINLTDVRPISNEPIRLSINPGTAHSAFSIGALIRPESPENIQMPPASAVQTSGRITRIVFQFPGTGKFDSGHMGFLTPDRKIFDLGCNICDGSDDSISPSTYNPTSWSYAFTIPGLTDDQAIALYNWATSKEGPVTYDHGNPKDIDHRRGACDGFVEKGLEEVGYRNGTGLVDNAREFIPGLSPGLMYDQLRALTGNVAPKYPHSQVQLNILRGLSENALQGAAAWLKKLLSLVFSWDPNGIIGPDGYGAQHFISGNGQLEYIIFFENLAAATASAQEVVVNDQLDPLSLDLSSVSFGPLSFGSKSIAPQSGLTAFTTDVDLRPGVKLIVRITANLNPGTGLLTWRFSSVDPLTSNPPTDPQVGFLPPNVHPPQGEGSVLFTVMPKQGLATGTQITNQASIVFDVNAPILTPTWLNTLDNNTPTSQISALPTQSSTSFNIQWSGTDIGAGIRDYIIYVSDNGGPFNVGLAQTTNTNATFTGVAGHTYGFYSIARDLTGNLENAKTTAEATTTVISSTADLAVSNSASPPGTVTAGTNLTYTIVATNNGPSRANSVTLIDNLAVGASFVSLTAPSGWSCTTPAVGTSGTITCTNTSMANGEMATFTVIATTSCNVPNNTSLSNTASVSALSPTDNNSGNNSQTVVRTVSNPVPIVSAAVTTNVLGPNLDHGLMNIGLAATARDGACPAPTSFIAQVFGNEDDQTPTDPDGTVFSPDARDIGIGTLRLRAERVDSGDGRVYLIIIKATDNAGGVGFSAQTVVVPKSQSPARVSSVNAQAAAAAAFADTNNGNPPAGFFVIGDGPVIGPKQ